jgi:hypothetical protein
MARAAHPSLHTGKLLPRLQPIAAQSTRVCHRMGKCRQLMARVIPLSLPMGRLHKLLLNRQPTVRAIRLYLPMGKCRKRLLIQQPIRSTLSLQRLPRTDSSSRLIHTRQHRNRYQDSPISRDNPGLPIRPRPLPQRKR